VAFFGFLATFFGEIDANTLRSLQMDLSLSLDKMKVKYVF